MQPKLFDENDQDGWFSMILSKQSESTKFGLSAPIGRAASTPDGSKAKRPIFKNLSKTGHRCKSELTLNFKAKCSNTNCSFNAQLNHHEVTAIKWWHREIKGCQARDRRSDRPQNAWPSFSHFPEISLILENKVKTVANSEDFSTLLPLDAFG